MQRHKRRPLRPERLHPCSREFYDYLQAHRPGWLAHAYNVLGYEHPQFDLDVELPHPAGTGPIGRLRLPAEPIFLWMNGGVELSVSYWIWHAHFGEFGPGIDMVDRIMSDEVVFVGALRKGAGLSAMSGPAADLDQHLEDTRRWHPEANTIIARSWSGRLDRRLRLNLRRSRS